MPGTPGKMRWSGVGHRNPRGHGSRQRRPARAGDPLRRTDTLPRHPAPVGARPCGTRKRYCGNLALATHELNRTLPGTLSWVPPAAGVGKAYAARGNGLARARHAPAASGGAIETGGIPSLDTRNVTAEPPTTTLPELASRPEKPGSPLGGGAVARHSAPGTMC